MSRLLVDTMEVHSLGSLVLVAVCAFGERRSRHVRTGTVTLLSFYFVVRRAVMRTDAFTELVLLCAAFSCGL